MPIIKRSVEVLHPAMLLRSPHVANEISLPFELKGSLFTLTVLRLFQTDRTVIESHLAEKIKQAPGFFNNTPVVIDLEGLADSKEMLDFKELYELLRKYGMAPVGVRNTTPKQHAAARRAGLPILPDNRAANGVKKPELAEPTPARTRLIAHSVRSGQEVYAADGDLIVLGAVSAGADVVADGNIHVYGPLRGRALAGVKGDVETWIFCQSLEAQLVSIAGRYQRYDDLDPSKLGKAVQVHFREEQLIIELLAH